MNREEILKKAQNETAGKDERELLEDIKAQKLGGSISITIAALISLALVVDGFLLENNRTYNFLPVACMFMAISLTSSFIAAIYKFVKLKDKKELVDVLVFGAVIIWAIIMVVKSFL